MVKVYAVVLALGFVALVVVLMGGALADNLNRPHRDPNRLLGMRGKVVLGAILGFGMGGMAGEFSPLELGWPVALAVAVVGGALGILWVRYAEGLTTAD